MKQIEFSPKVVTICELTAIADFNLVIPRSTIQGGYRGLIRGTLQGDLAHKKPPPP